MEFDVVSLSRLQFAATAMYHFLFVPLTLGLSIFALSLGGIGVVWADRYRDLLANFG